MSYCKEDGKDRVYFISEEDAAELEKSPPIDLSALGDDDEDDNGGMRGAIKPNGEIDWDCPCLKPMLKEPCGDAFREAFSCFVYSKEDPKGSDCIEQFKTMQKCFSEHPEIYGAQEDDNDAEVDAAVDAAIAEAEAEAEAARTADGSATQTTTEASASDAQAATEAIAEPVASGSSSPSS
eukprot:Opistho-2@66753